jgi:hypothetical protein
MYHAAAGGVGFFNSRLSTNGCFAAACNMQLKQFLVFKELRLQ